MAEWDPIGVAIYPEAAHEYDHYAPAIAELLAGRPSLEAVFNHLWWLETVHMGCVGDREATRRFAALLVLMAEPDDLRRL